MNNNLEQRGRLATGVLTRSLNLGGRPAAPGSFGKRRIARLKPSKPMPLYLRRKASR